MAYQVERCEGPEDLSRVFAAFFSANPLLPWTMRVGDAVVPDKVVVENKTIGLAFGWDAMTSYKKGIDFFLGERYIGGRWPGISDYKHVRQNWGQGRIVWPSTFHFFAGKGYFIVTVMNPDTGECHNYGGGTTTGIGSDHKGVDGKWASAEWFDNNVGFFGAFLGGKKRHYHSKSVNNWYMDAGSRRWQAAGGHSPEVLPPVVGVWGQNRIEGEGVHYPYAIEKFVFRQSATTVFLPCLMGKKHNGWRPAIDIPYMRLCSMSLAGTGDQIEYQGRKWRALARNNFQDANIGFVVLEDEMPL